MSFYDNILGRLAATIWTGTFFSCEKVSTSVSPASGGLCPLDTHDPFKKVSIPNSLDKKFRIEPFLKGAQGSKGQSPFVCKRSR